MILMSQKSVYRGNLKTSCTWSPCLCKYTQSHLSHSRSTRFNTSAVNRPWEWVQYFLLLSKAIWKYKYIYENYWKILEEVLLKSVNFATPYIVCLIHLCEAVSSVCECECVWGSVSVCEGVWSSAECVWGSVCEGVCVFGIIQKNTEFNIV